MTAIDAPIAASGRLPDFSPRTVVTPRMAPAIARRQGWQSRYRLQLQLTDALVVVASTGAAAWVQINTFAQVNLQDAPWQYGRVFLLASGIWLLTLLVFQTYETRIVGHGSTEYRRVMHATGMAFGVLAITFVLIQSQGIRTQLLIALPIGLVAIVLGRWLNRQWLVRQRRLGEFISRAIVVGTRADVEYVVKSVHDSGPMGYHVVGVTLEDDVTAKALQVGDKTFCARGSIHTIANVAAQLSADAVIVASTPKNDSEFLKRLSWQLEGNAAELVLSSPLADVVGPRLALKPVEGLPLIQVEIPTFEGSRYLLKRTMDIAISAIALLIIGVMTPFIALAIKIDDGGPILFRQTRVGRDGRHFHMLKFRSMGNNAEVVRDELHEQNEGAGPLFKMRGDPRITRVGAILRKYSIDELPQFWNVMIGDMSVVGPRPPLPSEVTAYDGTVYRRLYIKPGITGLWQISGRSDLSWEDTVRLDLRYVENWSVVGDLTIVWRTFGSVMQAKGAY